MNNQRIIVFKQQNSKSLRNNGINVKKSKPISVRKGNEHFKCDQVITLKSPSDINIPKIVLGIEQQNGIVKKRV